MSGMIDSTAAIALTADNTPAVQQPAYLSISGAHSGGGTALVAQNMASGDQFFRTNTVNPNAAVLDRVAAMGGCNANAVNGHHPPLLSAGAGLLAHVGAGEVLIGGPVQIAAQDVVVPDNTDTVWIWAEQNGTCVAVASSLTPPVGNVVLLGAVRTVGGAVFSHDASGVLYLMGGALVRQTADTGPPIDSPPSSVILWTKTSDGFHMWKGDGHVPTVPGVNGAIQIPDGTSDPTGTVPGTGVWAWYRSDLDQIRVISYGSSVRIFREGYDIAFSIEAAPTASQILLRFVAPRPVTLPAGFTGSVGAGGVAATAATDIDVKVNGSSVGTIHFAAAGTVATFVAAADVNLVAGDVLTVIGPGTPDATLAKIAVTLKGI